MLTPRVAPTKRFCSAKLPCAFLAKSGNDDAILMFVLTSVLQFCIHNVLTTSPRALISHNGKNVFMPLRFGSIACTSRIFLSDNTKSAGKISPRLRM